MFQLKFKPDPMAHSEKDQLYVESIYKRQSRYNNNQVVQA